MTHRNDKMRGVVARLVALLLAVVSLVYVHAAEDSVFRVVHSVDDVISSVENARHVKAVLLLSSASDEKLKKLATENLGNGDDSAMLQALEAQFPHVRKVVESLDNTVEFIVADIGDAKEITKKWNIIELPALVMYKDAPKMNPYTHKMYRDATPLPFSILQQPRQLKKLLKDSIPSTYVTEWTSSNGFTTLADAENKWKTHEAQNTKDALVVLVSKQSQASHLYRALSVEYESRGVSFAYVNEDEPIAKEIKNEWTIDKLPVIVVVQSPRESFEQREIVGDADKMKSFVDLKAIVEPFASRAAVDGAPASGDAEDSNDKTSKDAKTIPLLTAANFDSNVLGSKLVWIVSFMDAETEALVDPVAWRKQMSDVPKKAGVVVLGAVSCTNEKPLCDQYGGAGAVRVFPIQQANPENPATTEISRGEMLKEKFHTVEEAKQRAIESLPDLVHVMGSSAELNAFVARALAAKAMPVLLITSKRETPPVLKSLALSFPNQQLAVAVVSDADPQVRQQFQVSPSAKTTFVCLVTVPSTPGQPENAAPFGIFKFDKKTMGALSYSNLVGFMMNVLHQHPHPRVATPADGQEVEEHPVQGTDGSTPPPYLHQDNMDALCNGNKICAIGFFYGHVDTQNDPESPLYKSLQVLQQVARKSTKNRQPFKFMWTNGNCHSQFAESFGVGAFQMPTIVVYSPSKARYATNIGVFEEENASGFLRSVLSGKISTIPVRQVGAMQEECAVEDVEEAMVGGDGEADQEDDDLGDLLSEIREEEEKHKRELEEELAKERKAANKKHKKNHDGTKKDKTKKKKKKKSKGKKKRDEDHDEL